jgi:hypothetical protein
MNEEEILDWVFIFRKIMMKNHVIENDMIDRDHHQSNVIAINVHEQDQDRDLIIIDKNDIDIVDHVHHDEDDRDRDQNDVHLDDVLVQVNTSISFNKNSFFF